MRYYSVIIVDLENMLIKIFSLAMPCTKKEALVQANLLERKHGKILAVMETREINNRQYLDKFNMKVIQLKKEVL